MENKDAGVLVYIEIHKRNKRYTTEKQAKGPGQKYQLILQPVLILDIGTGCSNSRYFWPAPSVEKLRRVRNRYQLNIKGTG